MVNYFYMIRIKCCIEISRGSLMSLVRCDLQPLRFCHRKRSSCRQIAVILGLNWWLPDGDWPRTSAATLFYAYWLANFVQVSCIGTSGGLAHQFTAKSSNCSHRIESFGTYPGTISNTATTKQTEGIFQIVQSLYSPLIAAINKKSK
jgi:hypothetical protein